MHALLVVLNACAVAAIVFLLLGIARCGKKTKKCEPCVLVAKPEARVVVCFITRKLTETYAKTVDLLVENVPWIVAYVIVDDDEAEEGAGTPRLRIATKIVVSENDCLEKFYTHLNWFKPVCAWVKCLYALNHVIPEKVAFHHAWIIEDDCAFASASSFQKILKNYQNSKADLIATHIEAQPATPRWSNWHYAEAYYSSKRTRHFPELHKSFNVLMRISKDLLAACDKSIQEHQKAAFLEVFFINVCLQSGLTYENASDLQPHLGITPEDEHFVRTSASVFHPSKDMLKNLLQLQIDESSRS